MNMRDGETLPRDPVERRPPLILGGITLDLDRFAVLVNEQVVGLTRLEFDLLVCLIQAAGRVVPNEELLRTVTGRTVAAASLIRVHVTHLRQKLRAQGFRVETVRGRGLRFNAE